MHTYELFIWPTEVSVRTVGSPSGKSGSLFSLVCKSVPPDCRGPCQKNGCSEPVAPAEDLKALTSSTCSLDLRANSGPNKEGATSSKLESSLMRGMKD